MLARSVAGRGSFWRVPLREGIGVGADREGSRQLLARATQHVNSVLYRR